MKSKPDHKLCNWAAILLIVCLATLLSGHLYAAPKNEMNSEAELFNYSEDLAAFKRLRSSLFQLSEEIAGRSDLFGPKPSNDPTLLRPDMRMQILSLWYPIIDNYLALDAMAEQYMTFYLLKDKHQREQAFHLARGIFLTQYRVAIDIITVFEQNPMIDTILNEAYGPLGLPQGVYAHFKYQYLNVVKAGHYAAIETVAKAYKAAPDHQCVQWAEQDSKVILDAGKGPGALLTFKNGFSVVKRFGHSTWFPVQKRVAQWLGKAKVRRPHQYLVQPEQIRKLALLLEPGDILLERREWYLTNVGIPGFWPHAALYIGDLNQREALSNQPEVKSWLTRQGADSIDGLIEKRYPKSHAALQIPYKDGRLPKVIEAISSGVTLTSLEYSATCDSLAVLRPRLPKAYRAAAVVRAMRYYGLPYDFHFDFASDASLVCTELVVKSYLPSESKRGLMLPLEEVMGQLVTPANAFVRQFDRTYNTNEQQMDLMIFLDGIEKEMRAVTSDVAAFRRSWTRPKWHILVQSLTQGQKRN